MATVSRWRSSSPPRFRVWMLALEVFLLALAIFVSAISGLPPPIWFVLVVALVLAQAVLFYRIGRAREKLER